MFRHLFLCACIATLLALGACASGPDIGDGAGTTSDLAPDPTALSDREVATPVWRFTPQQPSPVATSPSTESL